MATDLGDTPEAGVAEHVAVPWSQSVARGRLWLLLGCLTGRLRPGGWRRAGGVRDIG